MSRPIVRHQLLRRLKGPLNFHCSGPRHSLYSPIDPPQRRSCDRLRVDQRNRCVEIAARHGHLRTVDPQPQVAPALRRGRSGKSSSMLAPPMIAIASSAIDQLLMIAKEIAAAVARVEDAMLAAASSSVVEELGRRRRAEAVDQQLDLDPALRGRDKASRTGSPTWSRVEHVHQHPDATAARRRSARGGASSRSSPLSISSSRLPAISARIGGSRAPARARLIGHARPLSLTFRAARKLLAPPS